MIRLALVALCSIAPASAQVPSPTAQRLANLAVERHADAAVDTLAELVAFDTFQRPGVPNAEHPSFRAMTKHLASLAERFGLDFADHGAVVVIGLGEGPRRLGVFTHGDVVPVTPAQWAGDPFVLDTESEPGLLVGRGTEDDKGPIACVLHAMRTLREESVALERRIELVVSYTEESDWTPFREFLSKNPPPDRNVSFDAEYPVVVAEKGWCSIEVQLALDDEQHEGPTLESFTGGVFLSQVPESAEARILAPTPPLEVELRARAGADPEARFTFTPGPGTLTIRATGRSAHSSKPHQGVNAVTHLAALLGAFDWPRNAAGWTVRLVNDLVGTGHLGERFGDLAYADPFMGPLTLSLGVLEQRDEALVTRINLRRPVGRSAEQVRASIDAALNGWRDANGCGTLTHTSYVGEPHPPVDAPHVPVLLDTFRHYTGIQYAKPLSIGGGTHARLLPGGVNFGPSMPGEIYTGHSEHEHLSREQFVLNLRMMTSLLVDLAGD